MYIDHIALKCSVRFLARPATALRDLTPWPLGQPLISLTRRGRGLELLSLISPFDR
jgi:hypothetical protein